VNTQRDVGDLLRENLPRYGAPESLREFVKANAQPENDYGILTIPRPRSTSTVRKFLYAAGILIAFAGGWMINNAVRARHETSAAREAMVAELVDNHVRSLIGDHLTDVRSTDQHTVKPWFNGKIDFAPHVVDLAAQGFPLIGGRVDYIRGRAAAALVYGRRRHFVNLFIWPDGGAASGESVQNHNGYSLLHWITGGMSYWAVTDASPVDLSAFKEAYSVAK
jgi:anti-sigma factor RsiW